MKLTKRKSFSFYRSYYDVFNELEYSDKIQFMEALLDKQFLDIDPDLSKLSPMVKFAYISQLDNIEKQVKGYCDKTKTPLNPNKSYPWQGVERTPTQGVAHTPTQQEKEKEKEKEKEDDVLVNIEKLRDRYLKNDRLVNAVISNRKNNLKNKQLLKSRLDDFCSHLNQQGRHMEKWNEFTKYFLNWNRKQTSSDFDLSALDKLKY